MTLPPEVIACGRENARRAGIDEDDGISFAAEAWALHDGAAWRTVTFRRCVDQRRHESGRFGAERRPVPILDDPDVPDLTACDDPALADDETMCDLVARIAGLPDADLAALARHYWLRLPYTPPVTKAIRHARRSPVSPRILDVLQLVAAGNTNQQIATRMGVSTNTVKTHVQRALAELNAHDRATAVAIALRAGWIV